jgi:hypothetical protein
MMGELTAFLTYIVIAFYFLFLSVHKISLTKVALIEKGLYKYYSMPLTYVVHQGCLFDYARSPLLFTSIFFGKVWMKSICNGR